MSIKQEAIDAISKLPDNTNFEEIMYRLYVIEKIYSGKEAILDGKSISSEDLRKEVASW
ncbi:MAG: hypothetical protein JXR70_03775 [Spirochaetales bacterium]|nr:hypothetical protein [Spirochaetales bacterium]